ncbi:MAG: hypothetical protein IT307_19335 [Chloroflexi bacterium]|nr:hypothetical protein [Chloroflexota bacterium]
MTIHTHFPATERYVRDLPQSTYGRESHQGEVREVAVHYGAGQHELIGELVRAKGLKRFQPFFVTGEGRYLPSGIEEIRGLVLDEAGAVYTFWIKWDEEADRAALVNWCEIEVDARLRADPEYREARELLGLPPL